jgi:hypothetical protein
MRVLLLTLAATVCASLFAQAPADDPQALVQGLMSDDAATRVAAEAAAVKLGAPMVGPLCDLMAAGDTRSVTVAERALFAIAAAATRSGSAAERGPMVDALYAASMGDGADRARVSATALLGIVGGAAAATVLGSALTDPVTHEASRTALERMEHPEATRVLCAHWQDAPVDKQPACLLSIGARRDPAALDMLLAHVKHSPDGYVFGLYYLAGIDALGMIGGGRAAVRLSEVATETGSSAQERAVGALIALADAEQQRGGDLARRCYRRAYDYAVTPAQKTAALMGLADTDPSMRIQWLLKGLGEAHSRRLAYAELLKVDPADLAGPLSQRLQEAEGEELEALQALAEAKGD